MKHTQNVASCRVVPDLLSLAGSYDSFVFDQFGVIHDGGSLYPDVKTTMTALRVGGKRNYVLTNSGRDEAYNRKRLAKFGIGADLIDGIITSGDVAKTTSLAKFVRDFGPAILHLASPHEKPLSVPEISPPLVPASDVQSCDFVYLSGMPDGLEDSWRTDFLPGLLRTKPPLLCSNPDYVSPRASGMAVSPGTIAQAYQNAGGHVELVGKPHAEIYAACRQRLSDDGAERPLFIGDSYHHDIIGALGAGQDCLLVLTGVHRDLFGPDMSDDEIVETAEKNLIQDAQWPTWIVRNI